MKKNILVICIFLFLANIYGYQNKFFSDYEKLVITKEQYQFTGNWDNLTSNSSTLCLYYKTGIIKDVKVILDAYYFIEKENSHKKKLGGFSIEKGFFDSFGKTISKRKAADINNNFWNDKLKGFSLSLLENPFFISGMALDENNNLYETEVIEMLEIDPITLELKEWYPIW